MRRLGHAPRVLSTQMNSFADSLRLLRTPRFGTFCIASLLSNLGTWAQQVAEPWLLLSLENFIRSGLRPRIG